MTIAMTTVTVRCVCEHNGPDTLLHAMDFPGAYTRGETPEIAKEKMPRELEAYCQWREIPCPNRIEIVIAEDVPCELCVQDADSDVLFECEKSPLTWEEYESLKVLAMKSAQDLYALYESVPGKTAASRLPRKTFYGAVPRTAEEMYVHTKNVNEYYFSEIDVVADNRGSISECRQRGFEALEKKTDFLQNVVWKGSYGEEWTVRKVLRRFVWHDRIHAKAMYRMAVDLFGADHVKNTYFFPEE